APLVKRHYSNSGSEFRDHWQVTRPRLTVQGGIGTSGEAKRLLKEFGMDATGWGSPFLMVPEATTVDRATRSLLENAGSQDLYLSSVSPLGVPFNNVRNTGSQKWHENRIAKGKPGSPCPKGFLKSNTEFTDQPICTASNQYQLLKLDQINRMDVDKPEKTAMRQQVLEKTCLCDHLGNGALINLGILEERRAPQAICPGPNIAWFDRTYSLQEMVDHIYGRGDTLVPAGRPHMFAKEIEMYVDYFGELAEESKGEEAELTKLSEFKRNLEDGIAYCQQIAATDPYPGENLSSIAETAAKERDRLDSIWNRVAGDLASEPS
ncbi:MAG: hypothetical protein R3281_03710, partial [Balneolaceae bacterium]|nr:hypothetical protein [Balneolaceae bacterium]